MATPLGLAAPNVQVLLAGVTALVLTLLIAAYNFVQAGRGADRAPNSLS